MTTVFQSQSTTPKADASGIVGLALLNGVRAVLGWLGLGSEERSSILTDFRQCTSHRVGLNTRSAASPGDRISYPSIEIPADFL